jgi:ABC-2 type transport system permease protein
MGVNIAQLRAILTAKLLMDDRRPLHLNRNNKKTDGKPSKYAGIGRLFISVLLGSTLIFPLITEANILVKILIVYSFLIIILSMMLISEFTTVLLDGKDNQIILPKPVNDRTFLLSRILHLIIFILDLAIPISIPAMVTLYFTNGIMGILGFMVITPFAVFFTVFLVNLFYLLMLKYLSVQKFKSIITYFQIILGIIIYGGYQIIPRLMSSESFKSFHFPEQISSLAIPSYWFAAAWQIFHQGVSGAGLVRISAAIMAFILPILSLWAMVVYFGPSFNRKLADISTSGSESENQGPIQQPVAASNLRKTTGKKYYQWLSEKFTRRGAEKMGFEFTWLLTARSRDFKLKTYSGMGYIVVYVIIMIFSRNKVGFSELSSSEYKQKLLLLSSVYITMFFMLGALTNSKSSDKYKAAWIFYISPIPFPGSIITGTVKSLLLKFCAPFFLLVSILVIWLLGWIAIPNLLLAMGNLVGMTYLTAYIAINEIPFSVPENAAGRGMNFLKNLLVITLPIGVGILHFFIFSMLPLVIICCMLSFAAVWLLHTSLYERYWKKFNPAYVESDAGI